MLSTAGSRLERRERFNCFTQKGRLFQLNVEQSFQPQYLRKIEEVFQLFFPRKGPVPEIETALQLFHPKRWTLSTDRVATTLKTRNQHENEQMFHPNGVPTVSPKWSSLSTCGVCFHRHTLSRVHCVDALVFDAGNSLYLILRSQQKSAQASSGDCICQRVDRCREKASHDRLKHFLVPLNSHRGLVDLGV